MRHRNGNELRYTFKDGNVTNKYPTVIVKTNETHREIDARLTELKFRKVGHAYESTNPIMGNYLIRYNFGPHSTVIFRTIEK